MAINITAAGTAGTHTFAKTNLNYEDDFIYYNTQSGATVPAQFQGTDTPYIYRNGTGAIGAVTNNTLVYTTLYDGNKVKITTTVGGSAINLTSVTTGSTTFDFPFIYNLLFC